MVEKATGLEFYHIVNTALLFSKVISADVVQSVSDAVIVNEHKTVLNEHPDTENKEGKHDKRIPVRIPEVWTITAA